MGNTFKVSYITTLPKEGNAPRVTINGTDFQTYKVSFYELTDNGTILISEGLCKTNQTIVSNSKQWYTNWFVKVVDSSGNTVLTDLFNPKGRVVFIKMDAYALGDTIAWIPYVEEFRVKHDCIVICSTFHNDILFNSFPNIMFVKPNTVIENVYTQFYVGASNDSNIHYSPIKVNEHPLQDVASSILGLDRKELRPNLTHNIKHIPSRFEGDYVTLSEFGSAENKHWKGDWQQVVNYFIERGIEVVVISKEKTSLIGVIDKSGDFPLEDRMVDLRHAKIHLGVSSGLSWLAWSVGTHVVMISDVTPNFHEFQSNVTRINVNELETVNYLTESYTTTEEVLKKLNNLSLITVH